MSTPSTQAPSAPFPPLTKEEIVFLIKAQWASLRAPGWTFKNRKDLEKIGEAIFGGKDLKDLDDALYDRIFPHLVTIATHLGNTLRNYSPDTTSSNLGHLSTQTTTSDPTSLPDSPAPETAENQASEETSPPDPEAA